jgi:hypothetical protein
MADNKALPKDDPKVAPPKDEVDDKAEDKAERVIVGSKVPNGYGVVHNNTREDVRSAEAGAPSGYPIAPEQLPLPFAGMDPNTAQTRRPSNDTRRPF